MDAVRLLAQAGERTGKLVEQIGADQLGAPTPCTEWDVRTLLNHVIGTNHLMAASLRGESMPDLSGGMPDFVGDDPAGAYRTSFAAAVDGWSAPGAMERSLDLPIGATPAAFAICLHYKDTVVHGWDLARATGQDATIDDEHATAVLGIAGQMFAHGRVGPFAPEVAVPEDAPAGDRLVALLGRTP